jgi:ABC-type transport system involved in multi-copper enzyme maturation permease subunit
MRTEMRSVYTLTTIARQAIVHSLRDQTVVILVLLFLMLVLVSAYLGWSATTTVNAIYVQSVEFLVMHDRPVPVNPVFDTSPLVLLRNMATYVSLIGSLAAIVVGYQTIAGDRKADVLPLLGSRALRPTHYGYGKIIALTLMLLGLVVIAALINTGAFMLLPEFILDTTGWFHLGAFYLTSWVYMLVFGLLGLACAAYARSESVALLVPVTCWLILTFVLPQLTSNINPVAALNPVSALAAPPQSLFFQITGLLLGPVSLAEAYRLIAAQLLDFLPPGYVSHAVIAPIWPLLMACVGLHVVAIKAIAQMDMTRGAYHV